MNETPATSRDAFKGVVCVALCIALASASVSTRARNLADVISPKERHCAIRQAPAEAGVAVTPGGFVLIFPRNQTLGADYTGCKVLWIADGDRTRRFATLYFKDGKLRIAAAHDGGGDDSKISNTCQFPEGRAVIAPPGQKSPDAGCNSILTEPMYSLRAPTWPRVCMSRPDEAPCGADPQ